MNTDAQTRSDVILTAPNDLADIFTSASVQDALRESWDTHVLKHGPFTEQEPFLRYEIRRSWERSAEYGIDPGSTQDTQVSNERFQEICEENELLMKIAYPILLQFYQYIRSSNYALQLCSRDACVLKCLSNDEQIESLANKLSAQREGYLVSEKALGTNSTALCLQERRPFEVFGSEHYQQRTHPLICSSAPIFDDGRNLLGCLTLMCPLEYYQKYTRAVLIMTTDSIGKEFQLRKTNRLLISSNRKLTTTINAQKSGLILLDEQRKILFHNDIAAQLLKLSNSDIHGATLDQVLPPEHLPPEMQNLTASARGLRVNAKNKLGMPVNVVADITIERHPGNGSDIVLTIERQKDLYRRTSQLSGAYATYTFDSMQGRSPALQKTIELGHLAAKSDSTVLILGESGTGKEMLAQAIHNASARANEPFLAINCASLPRNLIESELFGYERGSFTGANREGNPGKFELANGGTIFLDEIGDMPFDLQATLLRVLQSHAVTRIGGRSPLPVDVRIISATNRDLHSEVLQHRFREDLYYRLNVVSITLPPLRERPEDIPVLAEHLTEVYSGRLQKRVSGIAPDALRLLEQYPWPGNVRQLENTIERAVNFMEGSVITAADLPDEITSHHSESRPLAAGSVPDIPVQRQAPAPAPVHAPEADRPVKRSDPRPSPAASANDRARSPEIREYEELVHLLTREKGHVKTVASEMDLPISTLYSKLKKYNLDPKAFRKW